MDIMVILQIIVLLGAIFVGVRLGGIGIGYAGGARTSARAFRCLSLWSLLRSLLQLLRFPPLLFT